jgi:transposase-like protein
MGRPSQRSPEFKEEAVRLQRESGESITAVAKRLGLSSERLRRKARVKAEPGDRQDVLA